jgi:hypothetical protein
MPDKPFDNAKYPRITFRISKATLKALEARAEKERSADSVAKFLLEACLETLPRSLPTFSESEALYICNALNGSSIRPDTLRSLRIDILDDLLEIHRDDFDAQHLRLRLYNLPHFEWVAVVDAVQRYWMGEYHKDAETSKKRLREVGLVKD